MKIKFNFTVKNYNGGPSLNIYSGRDLLKAVTLNRAGHQTIELDVDIDFPTQLVLEHHGKNMRKDTKIEDGVIVDDKGFILEKINIGNIILENELYLFEFVKDDGEILKNNNYIGFNGRFIIKIDSNNLTTWYVNLQQSMTNSLPDFDYDKFKKEILKSQTYEVIY